MTEKVFQRELAACFRSAGWWVVKFPDAPVSQMKPGANGKLRFTLPKPCDLLLCSPTGQFGAIECKLVRRGVFKVDARIAQQVAVLAALPEGAFTALALNFRYRRVRPKQTVNRAFLFQKSLFRDWKEGSEVRLAGWELLAPGSIELRRIAGGWVFHRAPLSPPPGRGLAEKVDDPDVISDFS